MLSTFTVFVTPHSCNPHSHSGIGTSRTDQCSPTVPILGPLCCGVAAAMRVLLLLRRRTDAAALPNPTGLLNGSSLLVVAAAGFAAAAALGAAVAAAALRLLHCQSDWDRLAPRLLPTTSPFGWFVSQDTRSAQTLVGGCCRHRFCRCCCRGGWVLSAQLRKLLVQ